MNQEAQEGREMKILWLCIIHLHLCSLDVWMGSKDTKAVFTLPHSQVRAQSCTTPGSTHSPLWHQNNHNYPKSYHPKEPQQRGRGSSYRALPCREVQYLTQLLLAGHHTLDDAFQASFGTKLKWFKSTFKVNVCIFMAKGPNLLLLFASVLLVKLSFRIFTASS